MNRHRAVGILLFVWAVLFMHTVQAAIVADFVGGYDQSLLQWAASMSVLGGVIRTILSVESDQRASKEITKTAFWDALKALIAGMAAFIVIQAIRSTGVVVPNEIRFAGVMVAGWSRMAAFEWLMNAGLDWINARKAQIVNRPANEQPPKDTP